MLENLKPLYNLSLRPVANQLNRIGIHPNHITFLGLLFFITATWFTISGKWTTALILLVIGSLMDGLDGVLARESGKKSIFGAIFDSSCDRLTEGFILFGLLVYYIFHPYTIKSFLYAGQYLAFASMCSSFMVSYVKARCEAENIPCNRGLLQRPERLIILLIGFLSGPVVMIWLLLFLTIFATITFIQRLFEAAGYCKRNVINK
jgi:phosphatidylglycerophosphate synthase